MTVVVSIKNRGQILIFNICLCSLPKNEDKKNKWLDIIGEENLNPRHAKKIICSLHFDPAYFNKTLNKMWLRDDAVPSPFVVVCNKYY